MEIDRATSSSGSSGNTSSTAGESARALLQGRMRQIFDQLTRGCGLSNCANAFCASNPAAPKRDGNQAAALMIQVAIRPDLQQILTVHGSSTTSASGTTDPALSVALSNTPPPVASTATPARSAAIAIVNPNSIPSSPSAFTPPSNNTGSAALSTSPVVRQFLDLPTVQRLFSDAKATGDYIPVIRRFGAVFGDPESLELSFLKGNPRRPEEVQSTDSDPQIDFDDLEKAFALICELNHTGVTNAVMNGCERAAASLRVARASTVPLRAGLILLQIPLVWEDVHRKTVLTPLLTAIGSLPKPLQERLVDWFAAWPLERFAAKVHAIQQALTLRIATCSQQAHFVLNRDETVASAVRTLALFNVANEKVHRLSYTEFYNELILENFDPDEDFANWKQGVGFSFCNYPFVMDAVLKSNIIRHESQMQQVVERHETVRRIMQSGVMEAPFIVFKIRRNHLLVDTLRELDKYDPADYKKQLKVHFAGEDAVDEGGVQKEFFQLVVKEIFNPQYGMFTFASSHCWFNAASQDFNEFKLIGLILGLAIYNGVILDVHFPFLVYKKMMGIKPTRDDLRSFNPELYVGLEKLLVYSGSVETDIGTFFVCPYESFGEVKYHALKPNGETIPVTNANREEYAERYVQWLLDVSVEKQFVAFLRGFQSVCNSPAFQLLRPEELELIICGSPVLDFEALEKSTEYEGYTRQSRVVRWFWELVHHRLSLEQKKRLLFFSTGTDRAPVGGLGRMRFVIVRHGPDSARIPESHTCFNHFMLPDYSSKDKLYERLMHALTHAEGFGMV